jgi:hypothetical protein
MFGILADRNTTKGTELHSVVFTVKSPATTSEPGKKNCLIPVQPSLILITLKKKEKYDEYIKFIQQVNTATTSAPAGGDKVSARRQAERGSSKI